MGARWGGSAMAGSASMEVKAGALGGGDWAGEDQYGVEKAVGYLDWRMWGLRRWFNDELSSSAMADGGHSGRARGQAGLGFICAEHGGGRTGSMSSRGRHGCRG